CRSHAHSWCYPSCSRSFEVLKVLTRPGGPEFRAKATTWAIWISFTGIEDLSRSLKPAALDLITKCDHKHRNAVYAKLFPVPRVSFAAANLAGPAKRPRSNGAP